MGGEVVQGIKPKRTVVLDKRRERMSKYKDQPDTRSGEPRT